MTSRTAESIGKETRLQVLETDSQQRSAPPPRGPQRGTSRAANVRGESAAPASPAALQEPPRRARSRQSETCLRKTKAVEPLPPTSRASGFRRRGRA